MRGYAEGPSWLLETLRNPFMKFSNPTQGEETFLIRSSLSWNPHCVSGIMQEPPHSRTLGVSMRRVL